MNRKKKVEKIRKRGVILLFHPIELQKPEQLNTRASPLFIHCLTELTENRNQGIQEMKCYSCGTNSSQLSIG